MLSFCIRVLRGVKYNDKLIFFRGRENDEDVMVLRYLNFIRYHGFDFQSAVNNKMKRASETIVWVDKCAGVKDSALIHTPIANFALYTQGDVLTGAEWIVDEQPEIIPETNFLKNIVSQIRDHWQNPVTMFTMPLLRQGTEYQRRVWQALGNIPFSETVTYSRLAKLLDTGPRAVGGACRDNHFPLIIPCHRVVSVTGMGGYAGQTMGTLLDIKKQLLAFEASFI